MIRALFDRLGAMRESAATARRAADLEAELERLRGQNEGLKQAMRHCIDCEYRIEVLARRAEEGRTASGSKSGGPR